MPSKNSKYCYNRPLCQPYDLVIQGDVGAMAGKSNSSIAAHYVCSCVRSDTHADDFLAILRWKLHTMYKGVRESRIYPLRETMLALQ